jgi:Gpi18-like mannosyltransferase
VAQGRAQSDLAFFPLYPMLIRGVHQLTGWSFKSSAVSITLVASALAMVFIWQFVERLTDSGTASRSVALLCFFPWGFILSMAYSEGLLLLAAAVCLLALLDERWVIAGLSALLAGAARPNGFVLILPCAWAAFVAFRRKRQWRAVFATTASARTSPPPAGLLRPT